MNLDRISSACLLVRLRSLTGTLIFNPTVRSVSQSTLSCRTERAIRGHELDGQDKVKREDREDREDVDDEEDLEEEAKVKK